MSSSFETIRHLKRLEGRMLDLIGAVNAECKDVATPAGGSEIETIENGVQTLTVDTSGVAGVRCFTAELSTATQVTLLVTFSDTSTITFTIRSTDRFNYCVPLNYPSINQILATEIDGVSTVITVNYWN